MSDNVLIVLIVVVGVLALVFMFRDRITKFFAQISLTDRSGKIGVEAAKPQKPQVSPPDPHSVVISGSKQIGKGNIIEIGRSDVNVQNATQLGEDQKIVAKPDSGHKKK